MIKAKNKVAIKARKSSRIFVFFRSVVETVYAAWWRQSVIGRRFSVFNRLAAVLRQRPGQHSRSHLRVFNSRYRYPSRDAKLLYDVVRYAGHNATA